MATAPPELALELDSRIAAFERAWMTQGDASISAYLPGENHPYYLDVLCEAIRCDLELRWSRHCPRRLDDYRNEFPAAFSENRRLSELAYEEYRQRLQAGEPVTAGEYRERYGIDNSDWPTPESVSPPTMIVGGAAPPVWDATDEAYRELSMEAPEAAARLEQARSAMPKVGDLFLGFHLVGELGQGAFGRVFLARQVDLANRLVALKVSADLRGESDRLAQMQHTNIVPIYSTHRFGSLQAVCMPYFGSMTLADVIADLSTDSTRLPGTGFELLKTVFDSRHRPPSFGGAVPDQSMERPPQTDATRQLLSKLSHVDAVLWLFARLADGLAHAHERGILHRDLKPANILLTDDGQPMLLDFNLAADLKPASGSVARAGGTLPYMAPECLEACRGGSGHVDARSDLYSLGIILYKLLTGQAPFPMPSGPTPAMIDLLLAQRRKPPIRPRRLNPAISPAVDSIVCKLLETDVRRRYASAADLRDDLERHLSNRPLAHARDVSPLERIGKWRRRNPRLFAVLAATAAAMALFVMPASAVAMRQHQLAERRLQFEHAAAVLHQQQTLDDAHYAQVLLSTQTGNRALLDEGFEKANGVLSAYRVGDDPEWRRGRYVQLLSADQRAVLQREIGEMLLLMARGDQIRGNHQAAQRWNRLAEVCFAADQSPYWLHQQRAELDGAKLNGLIPAQRDDYHEGLELSAQSKYGQALRRLIPFSEKNPRHFMSWYVRGICHDGVAQLAEAHAAFTVCVTLRPEFRWSYFSRGLVRLQQKRFELAETDFSRSLELHPTWTAALINRAIAREGMRDWNGAVHDLNAALSRADASPRIYFLRAKIRRAMGDKDAAKNDVKDGLERTPTDALSWITRGVWQMEFNPKAALADFVEALKLNPRSRDALQNQAVVLADYLNRPRDAVVAMDRLLELYPDYVEARAGRGVYLARIGEIERACTDADACLLVEPTPYRYYQMAGLYAQLSRHDADPKWRGQALRYIAYAFRNGFADFALVSADADIDPLRRDQEFQRIVAHAKALAGK